VNAAVSFVEVGATRRRSVPDMSNSGPLLDAHGRVHRDLRLSLTDRCNLRCVYCMPATGMRFEPRASRTISSAVNWLARGSNRIPVAGMQ